MSQQQGCKEACPYCTVSGQVRMIDEDSGRCVCDSCLQEFLKGVQAAEAAAKGSEEPSETSG